MMKSVRCSLLAAGFLGLAACGGGGESVSSKKQAAALAQAAGGMASEGVQGSDQSALLAAAASLDSEVTVDCPKGGSMKLSAKADVDGFEDGADSEQLGGAFSLAYEIKYDGCKAEWDDPETSEVEKDAVEFNGDYSFKMDGATDGAEAGAFVMESKGKLEVSGAVSDELEMELTQTFEASGSDFTLTLDGFVKTSSETFTFDNETYTSADFGGEEFASGEDDSSSDDEA